MWLSLVIIRTLLAALLGAWVTKKLVHLGHDVNFFVMYLIQFICLSVFVAYTHYINFDPILIFLGFCCASGNYCLWRAFKISITKASLFMLLDDILAIALAWFLLDEIKELNLTMLFGAGLVLSACFLQAFISFETDKADKNGSFSFSFSFALILWSLGFGFAWGIVDFSFAYYNDQGLIEVEYGFPYYLGALLTSAFILVLNTEDAQKNLPNRFSLGVLIAIAALVNLSCFFLDYATYGLAPVTKVQPVLQFTGLIGPILVGLFIFNEKDALTPSEKRVLILGLTGAALVISS